MDNIHKAVQETYRLITALDVADRRDLSVPLRKIAASMWSDSVIMPNPFLFRKLEKDTLSAWYGHLASERERARECLGSLEVYFFPIRRTGCRERSEIGEPGLTVHRAAGHIFSADHTFFISNLSDIETIRTALALEDDGTMSREDEAIIRGRLWDDVHAVHRMYDGTAFGIPCTVEKSFFFHSSVDQHMNLVFASVPEGDRFAGCLRSHGFRTVADTSTEFERHVAKYGAERAFAELQLGWDPDSAQGKDLRSELGIRRTDLIQAMRQVRNAYVNRCTEPGMTEEMLRTQWETFWQEVKQEIVPCFAPKMPVMV